MWITIITGVCCLAGGIALGRLSYSRRAKRRAIDRARRNAHAYNLARLLMVMTMAGNIYDAADQLPDLEDLLQPEAESTAEEYTLFKLIVHDWHPPTVNVIPVDEEE